MDMVKDYREPQEIERRSFEIIAAELEEVGIRLSGEEAPVIRRCIHTTADFDYARTLRFSENAVAVLKALIRSGASVVTDTNMAYAGISKKALDVYGCPIYCFMADPDVAREAGERGITRASVSMERAMALPGPVIFVVGNAPTALMTLVEHYRDGAYTPAFVIGMPVGFVNVEASKELVLLSGLPCIVNEGRKGGSGVAAAVMNAVLYEMRGEETAFGKGIYDGQLQRGCRKSCGLDAAGRHPAGEHQD